MPDLFLSDITIMGPGYCVIGLERVAEGAYRSVRPMPPWGFAWREPFPFNRGDGVTYQSMKTTVSPPHVEDRKSQGLRGNGRAVTGQELVECLSRAEVSSDLESLFGCPAQAGTQGGGALWVDPAAATRSVCGSDYQNLRFRLFPEPDGFTLRAEMVLSSGERIRSIPIVDRDWRRFVAKLVQRVQRANPLPLVERFLNRSITLRMFGLSHRFARIGLPRPHAEQRCWLMLDSLFPQPDESWLDLL